MSSINSSKLFTRNHAIWQMRKQGHEYSEIARVYDLSEAHIRRIVSALELHEREVNRQKIEAARKAENKVDIGKNASGYRDPVAREAISSAVKDAREDEARFYKFLDTIFNMAELSGFHFEERVVVKDKKTGKVWR